MTKGNVEFTFPTSLMELEEVSSLMELRERLVAIARSNSLDDEHLRYRCLLQKTRYVYARCSRKECRASLSYRVDGEGRLFLTKAMISHCHNFAKKTRDLRFKSVR